ncbi:sensor histidine kinase [Geodermatophilus sp. DF01-2]|uniref:sensor histidine kinase n=1 Tax=Geodermatophilus sp. DF01-2 TaxID=2559610 RepID=UPI001073A701|nr:histidine kinase [Geodermatophilus sp. DF01_2]TFV58303.1 sensor histidine kinase [Geodermatophilus sp. DF01_2]
MAVRTSLSLPRRSIGAELGLAAFGAVTIAVGTGMEAPTASPVPVWVFFAGTPVLTLALFLLRRTAPLVPFLLGATLTALSPVVTLALLVAAYAMGRYEPRWPLRVVAAVLGVAAVAQPWAVDTWQLALGAFVSAAFAVLLPGAVGAWVRTRAELLGALRERAERAEAERELLARDAVLTERTRIAREMHDAVGHRVSLMVLQAGAIEVAARNPDRVEQLAGQVQTAGRRALEELRQMVGVLRAEDVGEAAPLGPQPGLEDLPRLVAQSREAGMDVALTGPAEGAAPVDPVVGRAAYRIVQEALTNAGRHAPGGEVQVTVERPAGELVVRVLNGPPVRRAEPVPGGGYGLVGLGERVRTLGGRLTAEPRLDGGFAVEAVLPT